MSVASKVDSLPEDLRLHLIELLKNPGISQQKIAEAINLKAGGEVISRASVNRYAARMKKQIEKTRQAREVAEMYLKQAGGDTRNRLGKVVNEQVRFLSFELLQEIQDLKDSEEIDTKMILDLIYKVSRGLKDLEQAEKLNAERESRIRKEAMEEAAAKAEEVGSKEGLSAESVVSLKREILGLS